MLPFARVTVIGLGLIGSSLARAIREYMPTVRVTGHDADPRVREIARAIDLCDDVTDTAGASVTDADLVVLCVPVRAMGAAAAEIADDLPADAIISDVGSCKADVLAQLSGTLPGRMIIPAHPVAGTENSGPEAGFASLFQGRWCIVTPPADADPVAVERVSELWRRIGADVETMDPQHHDLVLAVTSHIAASDPTMWRDVFLANKDAVLEMLQRFSEDLSALQRAIRWNDGDTLFNLFTKTRAIRRSIIEQGQDDPKPDFGRSH